MWFENIAKYDLYLRKEVENWKNINTSTGSYTLGLRGEKAQKWDLWAFLLAFFLQQAQYASPKQECFLVMGYKLFITPHAHLYVLGLALMP